MPETLEQPLSFSELVSTHDELKGDPFFDKMDLPAFSRFMKEQTGTSMFDAGLEDSRIKRASLAVDRFLRPVSEPVGRFAGGLAEDVGLGKYRPMIEGLGESMPRAIAETLPVVAGVGLLLAPEPTFASKAAGLGLLLGGAGSAGAKTYTETGSGLAGLISGGALAALPGAASIGRKVVAQPLINKFLGTQVAEKIGLEGGIANTVVPRFTEATSGKAISEMAKLAETGLESFGANVGVGVLNELAGQAVSVAAGQGLYNPLTVEHAIELAAGTLPFAAVDAAVHLHGRLTKNFTSKTMADNAAYVGQVREAQQLADTADMINRFRKTEMRTNLGARLALPAPGESSYNPRLLPEPKYPTGSGPHGPRVFSPEPGPFDPEIGRTRTMTEIEKQLQEVSRLANDGVLPPEEVAQRVERIQKLSVSGPEIEPAQDVPIAVLPQNVRLNPNDGGFPLSPNALQALDKSRVTTPQTPQELAQTLVTLGREAVASGKLSEPSNKAIQRIIQRVEAGDTKAAKDIAALLNWRTEALYETVTKGGELTNAKETKGQGQEVQQQGTVQEGEGSNLRKIIPTPLKAGVSAEKQTLQPSETNVASQIGAKEFFTKRFTQMGLHEGDVVRYTDIAEKIAAAFSDVGYARVGELVDGHVRGVQWRNTSSETLNMFVGLVNKTEFKEKSLSTFKALHTLGHELWHGIQTDAEQARLDPVKTYQYTKLAEMSAGLTPEQRADILDHTWSMMIPERLWQQQDFQTAWAHRLTKAETSHTEFMADMAGSFVLGLVSPDGLSRTEFIKQELRFSTPLEQQFAQAMYVPLRDIVKATADYHEFNKQQPTYTGKETTGTLVDPAFFENMTNKIESILKDRQFIERAVKGLADIEKNDPLYYQQLRANAVVNGPVSVSEMQKVHVKGAEANLEYADAVRVASKFLGLSDRAAMEKELGLQPRWWEKFFPSAQFAALYPQVTGVYNIVRSYSAIANDHLMDLMAPFLSKPSKFGHVTIDAQAHGLKSVASSKPSERAYTRLTNIGNEVSKAEKRRLTDAEIDKIVPDGTPFRKEVIDLYKTNTGKAGVFERAAQTQVLAAGSTVSHSIAGVLMAKDKALKWKDALAYGTGMRDLIIASGDPLRAAEVQEKAAFLHKVLSPQAIQSALEVGRPMLAEVQKMEKMFADNPGYSPETRIGEYLVMWKRPGAKDWGSFASDDFGVAKAKLDKIRAEGADVAVMKSKTDMNHASAGMSPDLVERWNAIRTAAETNAVKQLGESTEEMQKFRKIISVGEDAITNEVKSRSFEKHLLPRKLAEGREDINGVLGMLNYVSGVSHGLAKQFTREQAGLAFQDPELRNQPKLKDWSEKHLNNVINPTASELTALKQMNFAYFLGFNFSSMLIEGSQGVMTLVPQLTRDTGSLSAGYKAWGSAARQVVESVTAKDGRLKNKETATALEKAIKEGRVDAGVMQEFNTLEENLIPNLRSLAAGDSKLMEAAELVKKPAYWYLHAARWLYSWAPRANSQVAFVAAFDVARSKLKMDAAQSYDYAVSTVDRTMFGGGKAGRPVELFANTGKLQGVVGLMYSLQTYTFSTIAMMARLGKESISTSENLSASDKSAARKAFGQMLTTQVALGGALSLPMTAGLLAVIEQLFPESEARRKTREGVQAMLGGTDGLSGFLSDVALKGLPDAAGLDLSSRVGLSSLLGVNPYSGFQVGNLVGPFGSVVENIAKGVRSATQGEWAQAGRSILPTSYRNVLQLAQDGGDVKTPDGKLLYQPGDAEKVLMSVGFRPSSVSHRQEAASSAQRSEDVERARLSRFHHEQAELLLKGQPGQVRENLLRHAQENALYDARSGARSVVDLAQKATVPNDLTRSGGKTSSATRQKILSSYGLPPGATEQQLLLQRKSLERTLQIPGAGQLVPSEMALARLTDYLMQLDPGLPRAAAKVQAARMMGQQQGPGL